LRVTVARLQPRRDPKPLNQCVCTSGRRKARRKHLGGSGSGSRRCRRDSWVLQLTWASEAARHRPARHTLPWSGQGYICTRAHHSARRLDSEHIQTRLNCTSCATQNGNGKLKRCSEVMRELTSYCSEVHARDSRNVRRAADARQVPVRGPSRAAGCSSLRPAAPAAAAPHAAASAAAGCGLPPARRLRSHATPLLQPSAAADDFRRFDCRCCQSWRHDSGRRWRRLSARGLHARRRPATAAAPAARWLLEAGKARRRCAASRHCRRRSHRGASCKSSEHRLAVNTGF